MIFMSKTRYNALPEAARKIIAENSGEALSRAFGKTMADEDNVQRANVEKLPKHVFVKPTAAQIAGWEQKIRPTIDNWVKTNKGADVVLARFRAELANAKAGH